MQEQNYQIVTGVAIATAVLLLAGFFIMILIAYFNRRKRSFLEEKAQLKARYQQELLKTQVEMQEQIFTDISQEIHDNVGQLLSVVKVQLNIIEQKDTLDRELVKDMRENVSQALADLRDIARSLNGKFVQQAPLVDTVGLELKKIQRLAILHAELQVEGTPVRLEEQRALFALRMIQECIQNVIKHAQARTIQVILNYQREILQITVKDDGRGFVPHARSTQQGLGLQNIINRCALLGGKASYQTHEGLGTIILMEIPYGQENNSGGHR